MGDIYIKRNTMRLILTENQYILLEAILDEVSTPISTKIEKGGFIQVVYLAGETEKSQTLEVTEIHGGGKFITVTHPNGKYIVNIGGSLDIGANTFTILKGGEYKSGGKTEGGKILGPEVVGGTKIKIKNVTQVNISNSTKDVVDEVFTDLGEEINNNNDESDEERDKKIADKKDTEKFKKDSEKRVYDMIINNPELKKAFYHQPTLFNGLLKYGKAKGIGPAKKLISKYLVGYDGNVDDKEDVDITKEFSDFKVNKSVIFQLDGKPIRISYGSEDLILEVGKNYTGRYIGKQYIKGKAGKITYKIYMKENVGEDIYRGTVKAFFKENDGSVIDKMEKITIRVRDYNY